ncbi:MAG: ABC transporter substrate-binding protein [candidate division NC10 bacterium]|nr:ABC transporter substrate-binding protein [candidate division NC10 bacterium]
MKRFLVSLSAALVVLVLWGGSPVLAQSRSEVLVIGMAMGEVTSLDPARGFEVTGTGVMAQVYDRLLDFPAGRVDKPEASLAESWKVSADGLVWTFSLRKDVKFHSGNPLTADDVVYSFQRAIQLKDQPAFIITQFGLTPDSIKALDKNTVQITLPKKFAGGLFLSCLSAAVASVVDSQVVKQHIAKTDKFPEGDFGAAWLGLNSAGSGPFILRKWERGDTTILDANPSHFRFVPKVKRVIFKEIPEATSRRLQVEKGDIDIAWQMLPDQVNEMAKNKDLTIIKFPATQITYMGMNVTHGPLADKKVRQAIRYAVDYDGIVNKILGGAGKQINTIIPEGFAGYESQILYKTDLDKARQLMKDAGVPNGFETTLDHLDATPMPEVAQSIQSSLGKIGIKVQINKMVGAQLYPKYRAQKQDMILGVWGPDYIDPHTNAQPFADYKANQLAYRNMYYNDQTSKMVQDAGEEMDNAKRIALYQAANKIIQEDGPYVFLYQPLYLHAIRTNVQGFLPGSNLQLTKLYTVGKK